MTRSANANKNVLLIKPPQLSSSADHYSLRMCPCDLDRLGQTIAEHTDWRSLVFEGGVCAGTSGSGGEPEPSDPVWSQLAATVVESRPSIVAVWSEARNLASANRTAWLVKRLLQEVTVVAFGPYSDGAGEMILKCPDIDLAVVDEPDQVLIDLLSAISRSRDFAQIGGICFRRDGQIVTNPRLELAVS